MRRNPTAYSLLPTPYSLKQPLATITGDPMRPSRLILVVVFALLGPTSALAQSTSDALPPGLDDYVAQVMNAYEVPGVSLAIVKDGKPVLTKGYGVRRLGDETPVDARTLFGIASNTKAFTATAIGLLVEEGKVEWDAPVRRYLPWFQLSDPYVTRELTVRDLLVHRSGLGLGAGDLLWWPPSTYNRKEIARRLQYIPLATSFRSAYAYDNVLYLIAGELIEEVSGLTWEEFVASRILQPIGMTGSNVRHAEASGGGNIATPHARVEGVVRPVKPFASDNTNPAGGINASAIDMAKVADRTVGLRTGRQRQTAVLSIHYVTSCGPWSRRFRFGISRRSWRRSDRTSRATPWDSGYTTIAAGSSSPTLEDCPVTCRR